MPDGYLPPVVAQIIGDAAKLIRTLQEAKGLLDDFAKRTADAKLGADDAPLIADLRGARAELIDFSRHTVHINVGADTAEALAEIAKLRAEIDATKVDVHTEITKRVGRSLAAGGLGKLFGNGSHGILAATLWGETGGGFLSRLLSPLTMLSTMFSAGFGSLGSFAGFGPEHLAMTLGGLAGSATEATAGAGLLGLGAAGKSIVGGGADTLVSHTTQSAIRGYAQLAQTVAEYGKNSAQARDQANLLAYSLRGDSAAAKSAAKGIATAADALKTKWHQASSAAQVESTKIMSQVLNLASAYTGRVAAAAKQNLSIINSGLKPLFSWLKGPGGVGVFNTLEGVFKRDLPTAVHAFDQGLKLLLRTMALVAPKTGGFIKFLDKLFTRMNTTKGFAKWSGTVNRLIGDFRMWEALLKSLGHDLHSLFKDDAGEPAAIIHGLTQALQKLGKWEDSAAGKKSIMSVFTSHKNEIMELGKDLGELLKVFGKIYLKAAPALVNAVSRILASLTPLLNAMSNSPVGAWVLGLSLIAARMGLLGKASRGLLHGISMLALHGAAKLGLLGAKGAEDLAKLSGKGEASVAKLAAKSVANLAKMAAKGAASLATFVAKGVAGFAKLAAKGAAAFAKLIAAGAVWVAKQTVQMAKAGVRLAVLVAKQIAATAVIVAQFVARAAAAMAAYVAENLASLGIIAGITLLVAAIVWLATHWRQAWNAIKEAATVVWHFLVNIWHDLESVASKGASAVAGFFEGLWHKAASFVSRLVRDVVNFFKGLWRDVESAARTFWSREVAGWEKLGSDIGRAVSSLVRTVVNFFKNLWSKITSGVSSGVSHVVSWFKGLPGKILGALGDVGTLLLDVGKNLLMGLIHGVESMVGSVVHSVTSAVSKAYHSVLGFLGIHSPSTLFSEGVGVPIAQGVAVGITKGMPSVHTSLHHLVDLAKAPNLGLSGSAAGSPLARVEGLLNQLLDETRVNGSSLKQTAANTKDTVAAAKNLSSPAGVQAQLRKANSHLVRGLRVGVA